MPFLEHDQEGRSIQILNRFEMSECKMLLIRTTKPASLDARKATAGKKWNTKTEHFMEKLTNENESVQ